MEPNEYQRLYESEEEFWWFRGMRDISLTLLNVYTNERDATDLRVLDAGCGTGGMLSSLGRLGSVSGLDISKEALRLANSRIHGGLVQGSVTSLPFAPDSFDLVTSFDVIYHRNVRDDEVVMAEVRRVIRPGGTFLIRVPAYEWLRGRHDTAVHTRKRYGKRELVEKLERSGFRPVHVSFANCILFPIAALRRATEGFRSGRQTGSEIEPVPKLINEVLFRVLRLEARLMRYISLPFGLSLLAVARKAG